MVAVALKEAATERWGDEWFLRTVEHADGDRHHEAVHTESLLSDGLVIRQTLRPDDGDLRHKRSLVRTRQIVEPLGGDGHV
jgi:hypothetical protein